MAFVTINICQALKSFVSSAIDSYSVMYRALEPIKESKQVAVFPSTKILFPGPAQPRVTCTPNSYI